MRKLVFINIKLALSNTMNTLTSRQQTYLKLIWYLESRYGNARIKHISEQLNVTPPTVLTMLRQLEQSNFIMYDRGNGANLTTTGKKKAEHLIRKHRLIESFLRHVLKIEEPLLHEEAERLEIVISDRLIMKIDQYLGYPRTDPHGSIIPMAQGPEPEYTLADVETNIRFTVVKVPMRGVEKDYCHINGFLPGSTWRISQVGPGAESFLLRDEAQKYLAVSDHLAQKIKVSIAKTS